MSNKHYDYLVIGGGSGGIASANRAAEHGAKVAVIEAKKPGGTCVNVGCVPKKVMWYVSKLLNELHLYGKGYGLSGQENIELDFKTFVENRKKYIERLNDYYEVSYYEVARLDEPKKGYQKKYLTIDETNDNGEKLFKLVELITDDKKYPQKKANRIVGAIRVKEREKVS